MSSLNVHCSITAENGKRIPVTIDTSSKTTPTQLRSQVATTTKIPLGQLRLIFRGKMIKDNEDQNVIDEYKLEQDCVLHCMGKPSADPTPAAPPAAAVSAPSVSMEAPSAAAAASSTTPISPADPLQQALDMLRTNSASPDVYTTAVITLNKVLSNIIANPMEEKYRKVKVHNAAFGKRLGNLVGGRQAMLALSFTQTTDESGTQIYLLSASPEAWPALQQAKAKIEQAVTDAKRVSDVSTTTANNTNANPFGMPTGAEGMGSGFNAGMGSGFGAGAGMGGMGGANNPMAASAAANLMSNPEALQNMMQNPMVQQMIQNDPNIPPHVRQSIQALASNPDMMGQVSQLMSDPNMRSQLQAAMQAGGGMGMAGLGGAGMGGMPPMNNSNTTSNTNNNTTSGSDGTSGGNDQAQTEEEMIAEAIRRSLQDNQ